MPIMKSSNMGKELGWSNERVKKFVKAYKVPYTTGSGDYIFDRDVFEATLLSSLTPHIKKKAKKDPEKEPRSEGETRKKRGRPAQSIESILPQKVK